MSERIDWFPPIPESYYARMERVLSSLPCEEKSAVRLPKRRTVLLIAAVLTLLMAGTALAVGISRMQTGRDEAKGVISAYQSVVSGQGAVETPDPLAPTPYVILSEFQTGADGAWQAEKLERLGIEETVGTFTVGLDGLYADMNGLYPDDGLKLLVPDLWIESQTAEAYRVENVQLSINGGAPIDAYRSDAPAITPTPYPIEHWFSGRRDEVNVVFDVGSNPIRPDTTFSVSGTVNELPFTLTYAFTNEAYEALKAEQLDTLMAIDAVLSEIPDDPIPVHASMRGIIVEEIALQDHFLYAVTRYDTVYRSNPANPKDAPYEEYDYGLHMAVDGMITWSDFVSGYEKDGERYMIHRAYYPYGDTMPNESLIALSGTVFRVNWEEKRVTVPKDEQEYVAWRRESMALSETDYGTDYAAKVDASCDAFSVSEVMFLNSSGFGAFGIILRTDAPVLDAHHGRDTQPVVTVNGTTLLNMAHYIQTPNDFNGGSRDGGRENGFWLHAPAYRTLPETFTVTVSWQGGTVTFTVDKADFVAAPLDWDTYKGVLNL